MEIVVRNKDDHRFLVTIPATAFPRHDEIKGKKYKKDIIVKVGPIQLKKGRKPHGPE